MQSGIHAEVDEDRMNMVELSGIYEIYLIFSSEYGLHDRSIWILMYR
jgi:hypothetical protein